MQAKSIEQVLKDHTDRLMSLVGVVARAQGLAGDEPCIKVHIVKLTPDLEQQIPEKLDRFPVVKQETGQIGALDVD